MTSAMGHRKLLLSRLGKAGTVLFGLGLGLLLVSGLARHYPGVFPSWVETASLKFSAIIFLSFMTCTVLSEFQDYGGLDRKARKAVISLALAFGMAVIQFPVIRYVLDLDDAGTIIFSLGVTVVGCFLALLSAVRLAWRRRFQAAVVGLLTMPVLIVVFFFSFLAAAFDVIDPDEYPVEKARLEARVRELLSDDGARCGAVTGVLTTPNGFIFYPAGWRVQGLPWDRPSSTNQQNINPGPGPYFFDRGGVERYPNRYEIALLPGCRGDQIYAHPATGNGVSASGEDVNDELNVTVRLPDGFCLQALGEFRPFYLDEWVCAVKLTALAQSFSPDKLGRLDPPAPPAPSPGQTAKP